VRKSHELENSLGVLLTGYLSNRKMHGHSLL